MATWPREQLLRMLYSRCESSREMTIAYRQAYASGSIRCVVCRVHARWVVGCGM